MHGIIGGNLNRQSAITSMFYMNRTVTGTIGLHRLKMVHWILYDGRGLRYRKGCTLSRCCWFRCIGREWTFFIFPSSRTVAFGLFCGILHQFVLFVGFGNHETTQCNGKETHYSTNNPCILIGFCAAVGGWQETLRSQRVIIRLIGCFRR